MNNSTTGSLRAVLCAAALGTAPLGAATYYVAADGHDTNAGTSTSAPLQTLARATALLKHNDTVLLRRGDTLRGFIRAYQDTNVTIGAYGSGARPAWYSRTTSF